MPDFTIRSPRLSVAVSEATLVDTLVADGERVDDDTPLFIVETEKVETEIAAGARGTVHWTGAVGAVHEIGPEIGVIRADG